jgi:hypothetical protein
MAVEYDTSATAFEAGVTSRATGNITPSGPNPYCILMLSVDYGHDGITACTFASVAATPIHAGTRVAIYGIKPAAGVAGAASYSWNTNRAARVSVIAFKGVSPGTSTGSTANASGGTGTSSVSLASAAGQAVADAVGVDGTATGVVGTGHTSVGNGYAGGHGYTLGAAATHQWSIDNNWNADAVILLPSTSGNQVIMIAFRRWQNFLRDLRLGLVPPDMLRRTYRDLVTI